MNKKRGKKASAAVIRVGDGRGFVVEHRRREGRYVLRERYVVTAAHCLPFFPPCIGASFLEERTYRNLLAPLGGEPAIWAECLFADPVGDIAILGRPDSQALSDQDDAYCALLESATPLPIAAPGKEGWLLSLDGVWFRCAVKMVHDLTLMLTAMEGEFIGGMSGSPIVSPEGAAIGVACLGGECGGRQSGILGPEPSLAGNLPGWLCAPRLSRTMGKSK